MEGEIISNKETRMGLFSEHERLNRETGEEGDERRDRSACRKAGEKALRDAVATLKEVKRLQRSQQISITIIDQICKKAEADARKKDQAEVERALYEAAKAVKANANADHGLLLSIHQKAEVLKKCRLDPDKRPQALLDLKNSIDQLQT